MKNKDRQRYLGGIICKESSTHNRHYANIPQSTWRMQHQSWRQMRGVYLRTIETVQSDLVRSPPKSGTPAWCRSQNWWATPRRDRSVQNWQSTLWVVAMFYTPYHMIEQSQSRVNCLPCQGERRESTSSSSSDLNPRAWSLQREQSCQRATDHGLGYATSTVHIPSELIKCMPRDSPRVQTPTKMGRTCP